MVNYTAQEIEKLQDNLNLIRTAGGWTTEEFGEMIGVTKQTISNLENKKTKMTKIQYIAIRAVLDYEVKDNPENQVLTSTINLCLNSDEMSNEDREKVQAFVSGAKKSGLDNATVIAGIAALVSAAALEVIASPVVIGTAGAWLAKIIKKNR
jgi:transcriptional regulator with XRE-family HTH domain